MILPNIIFVLALTLSTSLFADQSSGERKPDFEELSSQLQLDEASSRQLKDIVESHRQQMESIRQQKQKQHEVREQHRIELLTVLSYEQLYKFEQYMHQFHRTHRQKQKQ